MKMTNNQQEFNNEQLLEAHNKLVKRIYELCTKIESQTNIILRQNTLIISGAILGILFGGLMAFNLFVILYLKGIIQGWFPWL